LEKYNGTGYRLYHPQVKTPYLWSYSNYYIRGKYVRDGTFSNSAVSKQIGAGILLRVMVEKKIIVLEKSPTINYSMSLASEEVINLQKFLNSLDGIYLKEDGIPGRNTSTAFKRVFGYFLLGDSREN